MVQDLQKANVSKRLAALMLDLIVFVLVAAAVASLISLIFGYGETVKAFETHYQKYEEKYNIDANMSREEYDKLTQEQKQRYEEASRELAKDDKIVELYTALINKTMLVVFIALFITFAATELAVPLIFKNGQTLGKKLFGIGVMRTDGVRISPFQVFVRAIFGKFLIGTLLPVMFFMLDLFGVTGGMAILVVPLIVLLQIGLLIFTKNNYAIHDALAVTVVVDMQGQMIFDTVEELVAYRKRLHEEMVRNAPY